MTPAERTPEEQAEIAKLEARQEELAELDDEWTRETVAEAESIETRLDEIEGAIEARAVFRREDLAMAGCVVSVSGNGTLQVVQGSSGGKQRLGRITKWGDSYIRRLLVLSSLALIRYARHKPPSESWLAELLARRPAKVAAVAMANKTAHIIWAVLRDQRSYRSEPPVHGAAA